MSTCPEPLTPPDCDLRGLEWMPLYGDRLFGSDTWLMASPEGRCAAMMLWWASWKQVPAGSIPDHPGAIAQLAGYGAAIKAWELIRSEVMRGWILCSDDRLYHPVVARFAREAMGRRAARSETEAERMTRQQRWRARQKDLYQRLRDRGITPPAASTLETLERLLETSHVDGERDGSVDGSVDAQTSTEASTVDVPETCKTVQDNTKKDSVASQRSRQAGSGEEELPSDNARDRLWKTGLATLQAMTGLPGKRARTLLGRFVKAAGEDCAAVEGAIREAESVRPGDPVAWLTQAIKSRSGQRKSTGERIREELGLDGLDAIPFDRPEFAESDQ